MHQANSFLLSMDALGFNREGLLTQPVILVAQNFFLGLNVLLSAFGGHGMSIEIMDSMWKPSTFDKVQPHTN